MSVRRLAQATLSAVVAAGFLIVFAPSASAADADGVCPSDLNQHIVDVEYVVDGTSHEFLAGQLSQGSELLVRFSVDPDCTEAVEVSPVAYQAPDADYNAATAGLARVSAGETGTFAPSLPADEPYELAVTVPSCHFHVDFVRGGVLTQQGPLGSGNFYDSQGRQIASDHGGTVSCGIVDTDPAADIVAGPDPLAPEVLGTVVAPQTEVLGVQLARSSEVRGQVLAATGNEVLPLTISGIGSFLIGAALVRQFRSRRLQPRHLRR